MKKLLLFSALMGLMYQSCSNSTIEGETEFENHMKSDFSSILDLPDVSYNYANPDLPSHFRSNALESIDNTPNNNLITNRGATLGRVLFYDKNLSANNTTACASCHIQAKGFADPIRLSKGFLGGNTGRNSMALANARYYDNGRFFWDERARSLEEQVLLPIQDEVEMGLSLSELVDKLQALDYYTPLFQAAFGSAEVTEDRISKSLSQFVRSMVSYQAKFDAGASQVNNIGNDNFPNFSQIENQGKRLFFSGRTECSNCHETVSFSGDQARNNGLDAFTTDAGTGGITGRNQDLGKFKVSSLRNISLTAPYMHDGRFTSLRQVIEFYNNGIQDHPNLDNRLAERNGRPIRMNLNNQEIDAIVAFLNTLTDQEFVTDVKFSSPFVDR
tara:strand:- start:2700 stop:3860 length:1161 start_codon:yes stop_codon:yes gene_type:complete